MPKICVDCGVDYDDTVSYCSTCGLRTQDKQQFLAGSDPMIGHCLEGRYLIHNGGMWVDEMIRLMREHFPQYPFPRIRFPRFMAYIAAVTDKRLSFAFLRNHLGRVNRIDNGRSTGELGIRYRPLRDSILDTCRSFLDTGVVRPR